MTASMTAFARQEQATQWGAIVWEIRSVNHRYLETQFRLPENLRDLEPILRENLRKSFSRGKLEIALTFRPDTEQSLPLGRIVFPKDLFNRKCGIIPCYSAIMLLNFYAWEPLIYS